MSSFRCWSAIKQRSILELCAFKTIHRCTSSVPGTVEDTASSLLNVEQPEDETGVEDNSNSSNDVKIQYEDVTEENQYKLLSDTMTPLSYLPYPQQLNRKFQWTVDILKKIRTIFEKSNRKTRRRFPFVSVEKVIPSPVTSEYRNKDEFNVKIGVDGNPKTVGFYVGKGRLAVCVRPTHLVSLKKTHIDIAQAYEDYIRTSPLAACQDFFDGGHWRSIIVRSNSAGQHMAIVVFHPQDMGATEIEEESNKLRDYFVNGEGARCNLTSLYFQPCRHTRCTGDQAPFLLLHGEKYITEEVKGHEFYISPDSFFQINTPAAELLYTAAIGAAHLRSTTTLLDICCGTGIISIFASSRVRGAIGLESVLDAVRDARFNAQQNSAENVSFVHGKVEMKLPEVLKKLDMAGDIVAIINPGRSGVHQRVIGMLLDTPQLRRIVYVSCKADNINTLRNFNLIIRDGIFTLQKIIPADLFPHTDHTELILVFSRVMEK